MVNNAPEAREFNGRGLSIVTLAFCSYMVWRGLSKSMGVLLPVFEHQFTGHIWLIGIIISTMSVTSDLTGLFTDVLERRLGTRPLLILCAMLEAVGVLVIPFSPNLIVMTCALVLAGVGCGVLTILAKVLIARHFTRHYTLACGISQNGQVLAFAFAPMIQLFVNTYGWRGATLLLAAILSHVVAAAVAVREDRSLYQSLPCQDQDEHQHQEERQNSKSLVSAMRLCTQCFKAADLGMILEFKFWIICSCRFSHVTAFSAWVIYFVPHLLTKGFTPELAANLCLTVIVGYILGTFIWAPFMDRGLVERSTGIVTSTLVMALTFCIDPWANSALAVAVVTFTFGISYAAVITLNDALVKDLFGLERMTMVYGISRGFTFLPRLIGGFLPGYIYEATGSYDIAFVVLGVSFCLALIPLFIAIIQKDMNNPAE